MTETTTTQTPDKAVAQKSNTNGAAAMTTPTNSQRRSSTEDRKMVYQLVEHIDENGRYNDALKPMIVAYASASGMSEIEARKAIDNKFQLEIGKDMKGYLDQHRLDRGMTNDGGRKR